MKDESRPALMSVFRPLGGRAENGAHALPTNVAVKCPGCRELLVAKDWEKNLRVCPRCEHHFRLSAHDRAEQLLDPGSFQQIAADLRTADPLGFVSRSVSYPDYVRQYRARAEVDEAVLVGRARIEEQPLAIGIMDSNFIGGSMGSVVGERLARVTELAVDERRPLVVIAASGGARMQEGTLALMQMAKTSAALARLGEAGLPFISVLTDPTTGGVWASFASLGDVILAEPGALIGFSGPRVVEQFTHQRLPKDTNTSEFVLAHGMLDSIVPRRVLRPTLARLLRLYSGTSREV